MLQQLVSISEKIGKDPLLVQGAGGNTSLKDNSEMYIKASGMWLADAGKKDVFVRVSHKKVRENIQLGLDNVLQDSAVGKSSLRPSIETTLHALMPHSAVLHTHPVELLALLIRPNVLEILGEILSGLNWLWVEYSRPGVDLTMQVAKSLENQQVDILILGNHGLVVGGDSCIEAYNLTKKILKRCDSKTRKSQVPPLEILAEYIDRLNMNPARYSISHSLALDKISNKYCQSSSTILYPDQAVFLGHMLHCATVEEVLSVKNTSALENEYLIVEGVGVFVSSEAKAGVEEMLACHAEILIRTPSELQLNYLSKTDVCDLIDWEPEKYRQSLGK